MARFIVFAALLSVTACIANALKAPSYFTTCHRDDPNINECATKNGRIAMNGLVNGDKKYRIPNLSPLELNDFLIDEGTSNVGLKIFFKTAYIHGLDSLYLQEMRVDLPKKHIELDMDIEQLSVLGNYNATGRVLILPVTGNGDANITVTNLKIKYMVDIDFINKKKSGKEHITIKDSKFDFKINGRAYLHFDNLFNGDRFLGDNMNNFLNENWQAVATELGPAIADAIGMVIRNILDQLLNLVPYDELFPPGQ